MAGILVEKDDLCFIKSIGLIIQQHDQYQPADLLPVQREN